jgi:hypothetical protein
MIIRDSSGTSPQNNMIVQPEQAKACDLFITRTLTCIHGNDALRLIYSNDTGVY